MTSLPTYFAFGTPSASLNVRDALASYRRSQYFLSHSNVSTSGSSEASSVRDADPEACILPIELDEDDELDVPGSDRAVVPSDGFVNNLDWDNEDTMTPTQTQRFTLLHQTSRRVPPPPLTREVTPLLRKSISYSAPSPRVYEVAQGRRQKAPLVVRKDSLHSVSDSLKKPTLTVEHEFGGKSTFGQTLFNSIAILLGIGMLSEPLAFAYAGWICGTILIIFHGFITCYTAKILAHFILTDPRLRSYADIGRKAFGARSTPVISLLFCLELFTVSVALVTLYADSLETIFPSHSANFYKVIGLFVFVPTVFLPLSLLSVSSLLGIMSSVLLIAVVLFDGFYKKEAPGSLWEPAPTNFGVGSATKLGMSFGLFMAGFSGHAVIPSLARDMVNPAQFDQMIDLAFIVATVIYAVIGIAGYCMFGNNVSEEFSRNLLNVPGYNAALNKSALWLLVISPLSKFGLATRPLNATLETILGLDNAPPPTLSEDDLSPSTPGVACAPKYRNVVFRKAGIAIERVVLTLLAVGVSIIIPEFSSMMGFLGAFNAFVLCVIGPVGAKIAMSGRCEIRDAALFVVASAMAIWGTFSVWRTATG